MKRRTAKPFTVEVRKAGLRKREPADAVSPHADDWSNAAAENVPGRDMRFRDAEKLFRTADPVQAQAPETSAAASVFSSTPLSSDTASVSSRRILPDLVAEAAISEAALPVIPQQRRRGRPTKVAVDGATARPPAKRGRPRRTPLPEQPAFSFLETDDAVSTPEPAPVMAVRYLAASDRRRAARDTSFMPRAERWKRRLPKVCW